MLSGCLVSEPGVALDLVAVCGVSFHIAGNGQGTGHQSHTVPKRVIFWIQLELLFLSKTCTKEKQKSDHNHMFL